MHTPQLIPKHVGLIPDGTRRWAKKVGMSYYEAYTLAMQGIVDFIGFMFDIGVASLSIYLLSTDNLTRKPEDLKPVFLAETNLVESMLPRIVPLYEVRVIHAGQKCFLPPPYASAIDDLCCSSSKYDKRRLYLLAAYCPLDEIQMAMQQNLCPKGIFYNLWVPETVDLVLRTSGEQRISNFIPLQSGYAEFVFESKHFNEMTKDDFMRILEIYAKRNRRHGK